MLRRVKIYTRTGDRGETGLRGGKRVHKDSPRVEAYGSVDELNSSIGLVRALIKDEGIAAILDQIQSDLFVMGAELASPEGSASGRPLPRIEAPFVERLERTIDRCEEELKPLTKFILPGGRVGGAVLHMARAIARRAERRVVALSKLESINAQVIAYLNRLSDLLFVLARLANQREGSEEKAWAFKPSS